MEKFPLGMYFSSANLQVIKFPSLMLYWADGRIVTPFFILKEAVKSVIK